MAGSPLDATRHYKLAAELTKANYDLLWHIGVIEGQAATAVALEEENDNPNFVDAVIPAYNQVLDDLAKIPYTFFLSIESAFRLARYLAQYDQTVLVARTLDRAYQLHRELSAHDQTIVITEIALLCKQLNLQRKFAFYSLKAAEVYEELRQYGSAYTLLCMIAPLYGLADFSESISQELDADRRRAENNYMSETTEKQGKVGRWFALQRYLMERIIINANRMYSKHASASACSFLLRALHPWLDAQTQKSIAADLWSITSMLPLNSKVDLTGLPVLQKVRPLEDTNLVPTKVKLAHGINGAAPEDDEDVFLFSPADDECHVRRTITCVADEMLQVEVFLSNPLKFEVIVQRLSLSTSGVAFEAYPVSLTLGPESFDQRVVLSGKPLEPGTLAIVGCHIRVFNLTCEHPVDDAGLGIITLKPSIEGYGYSKLLSECEEWGNRQLSRDLSKLYPKAYPYGCLPQSSAREVVTVKRIEVTQTVPKATLRHEFTMESALLLGEERTIDVFIDNVGSLPIEYLQLTIQVGICCVQIS